MTETPDSAPAEDPTGRRPAARPAEGQADPPRDLFNQLRGEMERVFTEMGLPTLSTGGLPFRWPAPFRAPATEGFGPAADLVERQDRYELSIDLPGVTGADIDLRLTDTHLLLHAGSQSESERTEGDYHLRERHRGVIRRMLPLPPGVDAGRVSARLEQGVLRVDLPKSGETRQAERRIEIAAG